MKSRFQSRHVKMKATSDQHRKKVTKLETQLKGLREEQSSTSRSQGTIKGRIGGGMNRLVDRSYDPCLLQNSEVCCAHVYRMQC